ncbi:hypothetical protein BV22DRAFT_1132886 [Leucogyrophana mollusca]|uniref:Uncharacterized protein n=1 Tax=Leucogyrophana mollusca TaxID=85980 RepID=A0ACB8B715_9AGAM|nr:hypothetical protein BV22DRAFT_1132886 [Leucogyrophana mollusca]
MPTPASTAPRSKRRGNKEKAAPKLQQLEGPLYDESYIQQEHLKNMGSRPPLKDAFVDNPKSPVANFANTALHSPPRYEGVTGFHVETAQKIIRVTLTLYTTPPIVATGDHTDKKAAERLCALSAIYQLHDSGHFDKAPKQVRSSSRALAPPQILLSNGTLVDYERAHSFMDFYCRRYGFRKPDIDLTEERGRRSNSIWEAVMTVGGRRIGMGAAPSKAAAQVECYLDVTQYLESCDPDLWKAFVNASKTGNQYSVT